MANKAIAMAPAQQQTTPTVDLDAPATLSLRVTDSQGRDWGTLVAEAKDFATGSTGFYASGKLVNPASGAKYQTGLNVILIGSKPGSKA